MANITHHGNHSTVQEFHCTSGLYGSHGKKFFAALNIMLSISAFLGNFLIIVALKKASSLYPTSKLLFGCLASTDLCVGLITQPLYVTILLSTDNTKLCFYSLVLTVTVGAIFSGVSLLTLTAISVDRLLALLLGMRYRHVVTLRRVKFLVAIFWFSVISIAILLLYSAQLSAGIGCIVVLLCVVTSTFSYSKIYFQLRRHQTQVQNNLHQEQPNGGRIPLNIARYRKTVSTALWVQMTLAACYLPFGIVITIRTIAEIHTPSVDIAWDGTATLLLLNSSLNPFLYCWKVTEVRQTVKDTVREFCCFWS